MSWPGQMHLILHAGTKKAVEVYFSKNFHPHLKEVWLNASTLSQSGYDAWHKQRATESGDFLEKGDHIKTHNRNKVSTNHRGVAVATKLLNTFMHQLMKYEACLPLWKELHLVLDGRVFKALSSLESEAVRPVAQILRDDNPYKISCESYSKVQNQLRLLVEELNKRSNAEYKLISRIELNILWAQ